MISLLRIFRDITAWIASRADMGAVPWPDFDLPGTDDPGPPAGGEIARPFGVLGQASEESAIQWGKSESFDPDNVGDIADEGIGHRG